MVIQSFIQTALLGTHKPEVPVELPKILQNTLQQIDTENVEANFYQRVNLVFAYQYGGKKLPSYDKQWREIPPAQIGANERELPVNIGQILQQWLREERWYLCQFAWQQLAEKGYVLPLFLFNDLIKFNRKRPHLLPQLEQMALLGSKGKWLLNYTVEPILESDVNDDNWELAPFAQRKLWLKQQRQQNPALARAQIENLWKTASAAHRSDYIELFAIQLNADDEPFLTNALKDRSVTVREKALRLLERLPDSALVQQYEQWLMPHLSYQEKWCYQPFSFNPAMKAFGFEQISSYKGESDEAFLLRQFVERLPLTSWAKILQRSVAQSAVLLAQDFPIQMQYFDLCSWVRNLKYPLLTKSILTYQLNNETIQLFTELSCEDREEMLQSNKLQERVNLPFYQEESLWGEGYALQILKQMLGEKRYYFNEIKDFLEQCVASIAIDNPELQKCLLNVSNIAILQQKGSDHWQIKTGTFIQALFEQKQKFIQLLEAEL